MKHDLSFDDEDLEQFDPKVREALLRLSGQAQPAEKPEPDVRYGPRSLDVVSRNNGKERQQQFRDRFRTGGFVNIPDRYL